MKKSISMLLYFGFISFIIGDTNYCSKSNFADYNSVEINLSHKAYELIQYYNVFPANKTFDPSRPSPRVLRSPKLKSEHLTEKYRLAWEELLPYWVSSIAPIHFIRIRIEEYFIKTKYPQSVPAVYKAFKQTVNSQNRISYIDNRQKFLLDMFLYIRTDEAFESLIKSLNLFEVSNTSLLKVYTKEELLCNNNPWVYYKRRMLSMNRLPKTDLDINGLNITKNWQKMAINYDTSGLQPKTKQFVEDLAAYRHPYIDYSDNPIFGTNVIEVLAETNTVEQIIEETVITNLIVETVEPIPDIEISTNDVEEIVIVDEETPSKNRMLIILIIAIAVIIIGVIVSRRKSR